MFVIHFTKRDQAGAFGLTYVRSFDWYAYDFVLPPMCVRSPSDCVFMIPGTGEDE